jgi:hypothetical protein
MHALTIVAYAADAALYCVDCIEKVYVPRCYIDSAAWWTPDREGNPITPVFAVETFSEPQACDACGGRLPVVVNRQQRQRRRRAYA